MGVVVGASGDAASGAAGRCRSEGHSSAATTITAKVATPHLIADRSGVPGLAAAMEGDSIRVALSPANHRASLSRAAFAAS